jgi:hypothetical protein
VERTINAMSTPGIHDAWDARLRRVNAWVTRRTLVVFACPVVTDQIPEPRMEQVGSGVLYEEDHETFVLTAAHVADWFQAGQHVLAVKGAHGKGKPTPLRKTSFKATPMPPSGDRDQDAVDVSAIYVPRAEASELRQQCDAIGWTELDLEHEPRPDDGIEVCGFPVASPWSRQADDGHIAYEVVPAALGWKSPVPPKLTRTFGGRALFPMYARSKKKMVSTNPGRDIPHPRGFSGGGVWLHARRVQGLPRPHWTESEIRLVGIVHKMKPDYDCLVATRVSEAVQLARDLRDHVLARGA